MQHHTPLDVLPLWAVPTVLLVSLLLTVEGGYRLARSRRCRSDQEKEAPVGQMVAGQLGLLAFLLAFTFGIAASRFEARRQLLLDEANAIGTAYLRAALLPEPNQEKSRRLLREYVDVRIAAVKQGAVEAQVPHSEALHALLWGEAVAVAQRDHRSVAMGLFVEAVNVLTDLHAKRVTVGLRTRISTTLWAVLFAVAGLAFGSLGYYVGLTGTSRSPMTLAVVLTFTMVIWLIADLDRPQQGWLRVSQQPLIDLRTTMEVPP